MDRSERFPEVLRSDDAACQVQSSGQRLHGQILMPILIDQATLQAYHRPDPFNLRKTNREPFDLFPVTSRGPEAMETSRPPCWP